MLSNDCWRDNWRTVSSHPTETACVDIGRSRAARAAATRTVSGLRPGVPVVVRASAPRATTRCRRFAAATGIEVERAYLAFPSAAAPAYLVENAPAPIREFVRSVLVTPPGAPFSTAIEACLSILRALNTSLVIRAFAPGGVIVGRRA
jgi:hypothetical protein